MDEELSFKELAEGDWSRQRERLNQDFSPLEQEEEDEEETGELNALEQLLNE